MKLRKDAGETSSGGILLILVAVIMLLISLFILSMQVGQSKRCTYKTTALVVKTVDYDDPNSDSNVTYAYFSYKYKGASYYERQSIQNISMVNAGNKVTIYLDPHNPKDFYYLSEAIGNWVLVVLIALIGGVCGFAGVRILIGMFKKNNIKDTEE